MSQSNLAGVGSPKPGGGRGISSFSNTVIDQKTAQLIEAAKRILTGHDFPDAEVLIHPSSTSENIRLYTTTELVGVPGSEASDRIAMLGVEFRGAGRGFI